MDTGRERQSALKERLKTFWNKKITGTKALTTAGAFCVAGVMAVSMGQMTHEVTIVFDGVPTTVNTYRQDAASILALCQVDYDDTHEIRCCYADGNLETIHLTSALEVRILADGEERTVRMHRGTVADAVERSGIVLGESDITDIPLTDPIADGMEIEIKRVEKVVTSKTVPIEYPTEEITSALYPSGSRTVVCKGKDGEKEILTTDIYVEGVLTGTEVEERVILEAVPKKVMIGAPAGEVVSPLRFDDLILNADGVPLHYEQKIVGVATAYGIMDGSRTSTGIGPGVGYIAVNPKLIPYGSRLYIRTANGKFIYGCAVAADTGPSVMENKTVADLFLETENEIERFGRRTVEIYVLESGKTE